MELNLKGKKAIVTGSSSGIGEGIAKCLAREGVHVMIQGRKKEKLQRVVREITSNGGVAHYIEGDLTKDSDTKRIAATTLQVFGQLDILVNNAGAFPKRTWLQSTPQNWLDLFNVNVVGMVRLILEFLPQMKTLGWGRIIQIASVAGISPSASLPEYGVTKAAIINLTLSLAKDLAGVGITVNTVSPGPIATPGTKELFQEMAIEKNWGTDWKEIEKKITAETLHNLARRFGTPEEVGNLVTFLASPVADFITGANYRIDGGRLA
jgi:NAD(P)-dependent dehydrogenase (short-subunit alcohol dehydrogenase family)